MREYRIHKNRTGYFSGLLSFSLISILLFSSCNNFNNKKLEDNLSKKKTAYKLDIEKTEIIWNAYKTNDKIKVEGSFNKFSFDREDQSFDSVYNLIDGLQFSINSLSSSSGDSIRDLNLKDYFFKYLTQDFRINGVLGRPINDSIDVIFTIFGKKRVIRLSFVNYVIPTSPSFDQVVELKGKINLAKQFNAMKAYNSIHERCIDLHKGADGVSKTWKEVVVNVRTVIINTSFDRIKNH